MTSPTTRRLVSLVPSATETLVALGADVVGCTRFCKQPGIATFGGTKNPDVAAIIAAAPDAVVVDVEENRREDADALREAGLDLVVTTVRSVDDALAVVGQLASAAGVAAPPRMGIEPAFRRARKVFVPIWRRPWMTIGRATYGASLLASLGWEVAGPGEGDYPTVSLEDSALRSADLVAVPSEPYSFSDAHIDELHEAFAGIPIMRVDGEDLFWWGIRTPAAHARLAAALAGVVPE